MASDVVISAGLRADIMRKQMESKNTLDTKGSLYVGKGTTTNVATNTTVCDTGKLAAGANGLPLIADSTQTLGLKYAKIDKTGLGAVINTGSASANGITVSLGQVNVANNDGRFNIGISCEKVDWSRYTEQLRYEFGADAGTTISPRDIIYVSGSSDFYKMQVRCATGDNLEIRNTLGDDVSSFMTWYGNDTEMMRIQGTGSGTSISGGTLTVNGTINANSFVAISDKRLKDNIKNYEYHDSILDIPVKEYDYKKTGIHSLGFIAQDLQEKYPELVEEDDDGMLAIKETKLVYLLLLEIKKLNNEIKILKQQQKEE